MSKTVLCSSCRKHVSPSIALWDGLRLIFKCPECEYKNSQAGRFRDLLLEVH